MGLGHSPRIVTSGLVGYWDAGNPKSYSGSGNTWIDISNTGNSATLTGSPTYSTTKGGALTFNGSTQYGSVSNNSSLVLGTSFSVNVWCSGNGMATFDTFIGKSTSNAWSDGFGLFFYNTTIRFFVNGYTAYYAEYTSTNTFGVTNFTGVYNGANVLLYRNGDLVKTGTALTASVNNPTTPLYLMNGGGASWAASGDLYNASLYNRALSPQEVKQNFRATRGRFGI